MMFLHAYLIIFGRRPCFFRFAEYMRKIKEGSGTGGADQEFVDKTYADWIAGKGASPCSVFNKNYKADCRLVLSS